MVALQQLVVLVDVGVGMGVVTVGGDGVVVVVLEGGVIVDGVHCARE